MEKTIGYYKPDAKGEDVIRQAQEKMENEKHEELLNDGFVYIGSSGLGEDEKTEAIGRRIAALSVGEEVDLDNPIE